MPPGDVVCYLLRYKFWKLFTTRFMKYLRKIQLYVIYFDTNFESYSQPCCASIVGGSCCMLSTSIQILKAIHNNQLNYLSKREVVCYLLRYKFWKLFTTENELLRNFDTLYVIYFDTNFESYSQPRSPWSPRTPRCMLSISIQIL